MGEITRYFRVKRSDSYFPFTMSYLDEFTNEDISRIMGFTGNTEIEEISFDEYVNGSRGACLLANWGMPHIHYEPKPRMAQCKHGKTDAQFKKEVAKRRKKNKNKKTHRK